MSHVKCLYISVNAWTNPLQQLNNVLFSNSLHGNPFFVFNNATLKVRRRCTTKINLAVWQDCWKWRHPLERGPDSCQQSYKKKKLVAVHVNTTCQHQSRHSIIASSSHGSSSCQNAIALEPALNHRIIIPLLIILPFSWGMRSSSCWVELLTLFHCTLSSSCGIS